MTTINYIDFKCYVCGHQGTFPIVASTNQFGSPDLDMRPPEMFRSTMHSWVQCCENCGYCAPVINKGSTNAKNVIDSAEYITLKIEYVIPKLANHFLRWSTIAKSTGHIDEAGWASLHAAWVLDDLERVTDARHCRKKAIDLFGDARKQGISFAEDKKTETVILVDMLRRCGQFTVAKSICEKALEQKTTTNVNQIFQFQIYLIEKMDIYAHCCDEIE